MVGDINIKENVGLRAREGKKWQGEEETKRNADWKQEKMKKCFLSKSAWEYRQDKGGCA